MLRTKREHKGYYLGWHKDLISMSELLVSGRAMHLIFLPMRVLYLVIPICISKCLSSLEELKRMLLSITINVSTLHYNYVFKLIDAKITGDDVKHTPKYSAGTIFMLKLKQQQQQSKICSAYPF